MPRLCLVQSMLQKLCLFGVSIEGMVWYLWKGNFNFHIERLLESWTKLIMRSVVKHLLFEKHPIGSHKALERKRGESANGRVKEEQFPYSPLKCAVPLGNRWVMSLRVMGHLMFGSWFPANFYCLKIGASFLPALFWTPPLSDFSASPPLPSSHTPTLERWFSSGKLVNLPDLVFLLHKMGMVTPTLQGH